MAKKLTFEELEWKFKELADEVARRKTSENSLRESANIVRKERDLLQEAMSADMFESVNKKLRIHPFYKVRALRS